MTAQGSTHALRDELFRQTFDWCRARSPFYRERFRDIERVEGTGDLPRLPVLFRRDVVEHHARLSCDGSLPSAVQHTTGTTGAFLQLHRSQAEQAFIWDFFSAQLHASGIDPSQTRPLHMNLVNPYHGALLNVPSRAYVMSVGVFDRAQAQQARGVLERIYDLPGVESRVSVVSGTERMIMALTAYLIADGFDLQACPVHTLALFGGHVPASRKRMLADLWRADVRDQYSLTEMFGGARECGIGGPWVFDPHVIPEVVHPITLEPVVDGIGVLLLTGLYPFVQQMPLLRYFTGDLVEIVGRADDPAGLQVRYVGRMPRSVIETSRGPVAPLLLSGPLYEALIELPDLAITPRFPDLPAGLGLELTGDHHYQVIHRAADDRRPEQISLRLGLRYAPWMFPDRVAEIVDALTDRLFLRHPRLAERCAEGSLVFRVIPLPADAVAPHDSK